MPTSAIDVVSSAFEHAKNQLFRPFNLGQWVRLGIVGFLAGEMGYTGGCSYRSPLPPGSGGGGRSTAFIAQATLIRNPLFPLAVILLVLAGLVLFVAFMYVSSMMRFVLFDSVVSRECHVRRFWSRHMDSGIRYFLWQLAVGFIGFSGVGILAGTAAIIGYSAGWLRSPREHVIPLVLGGVIAIGALALWFVAFILVHVFTKDFVVPQMALENVGPLEGWRRLLQMMAAEKARYAGYIGMKILLMVAALILMTIATIIVVLVYLIPTGILALLAILIGKTIGLTWNPLTIGMSLMSGIVALAFLIYLMLLLNVPPAVFFPAFSIYFLAARYPALDARLRLRL